MMMRLMLRNFVSIILVLFFEGENGAVSALSSSSSSSSSSLLPTVKNLRAAIPGSTIYRSATLDELSMEDAERLLSGSAFVDGRESLPLAAVIDLRNDDEIEKGIKKRTDGSNYFYSQLTKTSPITSTTSIPVASNVDEGNDGCRLYHIPILRDLDAFWDEAIDRMDASERIMATLRTTFQGGALDRAAARNLEQGGPALLYTVMLASCSQPLMRAFELCCCQQQRGPIIFHCQKGKDRTGVLSMLLQSCIGDTDDNIIQSYALSGPLLGGEDDHTASTYNNPTASSKKNIQNGYGLVDWSYFRGSPANAMEDTLDWIRQNYGSIDNFLDASSVDKELLKQLKSQTENTLF